MIANALFLCFEFLRRRFLNNHVFLAAPFKQLLTQDKVIDSQNMNLIKQVIQLLVDADYAVDNAHQRESWGQHMMTPDECTAADFDAIKKCQMLMAFPGSPASPGTHIEIGWASAFDKPIVLLLQENTTYAYLVSGLRTVSCVNYVYYKDATDCLLKIKQFLTQKRCEGK